jgi:hypothetical protein
MSENVEVVRRMYEARDGADGEGVLACFDPEVVLDARVRMDSDIVHGREAAARVIGEWVAAFDDWSEEIHEISDLGSQVYVVATQRGRAKGAGSRSSLAMPCCTRSRAARSRGWRCLTTRPRLAQLPRPRSSGCRRTTWRSFGAETVAARVGLRSSRPETWCESARLGR